MTEEFRMAYIQSVKVRHKKATKAQKGWVLDELCRVCHLNRKYVITKIHQDLFKGTPSRSNWRAERSFTLEGSWRSRRAPGFRRAVPGRFA